MSKNEKMACYLLIAVAVGLGIYYLGKYMQWWGEEHYALFKDKEKMSINLNSALNNILDAARDRSEMYAQLYSHRLISDLIEANIIPVNDLNKWKQIDKMEKDRITDMIRNPDYKKLLENKYVYVKNFINEL
jgi:hypothetical protein